jgi:hypothetical protein
MHNIVDNKHERNCLFTNLCGHIIMDICEGINTIRTNTNKLVTDLLDNEIPID